MKIKALPLLQLVLLIVISEFLVSCKTYKRNDAHAEISYFSIKKGEGLAKEYCQSCHMLPDPALLDTKSWEKGVLPQMGPRLGIIGLGSIKYPSYKRDMNLDKSYYPSQPVITEDDWQNIIDYYMATAPDSLPSTKKGTAYWYGIVSFFRDATNQCI